MSDWWWLGMCMVYECCITPVWCSCSSVMWICCASVINCQPTLIWLLLLMFCRLFGWLAGSVAPASAGCLLSTSPAVQSLQGRNQPRTANPARTALWCASHTQSVKLRPWLCIIIICMCLIHSYLKWLAYVHDTFLHQMTSLCSFHLSNS